MITQSQCSKYALHNDLPLLLSQHGAYCSWALREPLEKHSRGLDERPHETVMRIKATHSWATDRSPTTTHFNQTFSILLHLLLQFQFFFLTEALLLIRRYIFTTSGLQNETWSTGPQASFCKDYWTILGRKLKRSLEASTEVSCSLVYFQAARVSV